MAAAQRERERERERERGSALGGIHTWAHDEVRLTTMLELVLVPSTMTSLNMATKYIVSSLLGSFVIAFTCDHILADRKIFGGTTPKTVSNKEWWEETEKKFQAWPRTAGPPVVMNPISRQNFIVKSRSEA